MDIPQNSRIKREMLPNGATRLYWYSNHYFLTSLGISTFFLTAFLMGIYPIRELLEDPSYQIPWEYETFKILTLAITLILFFLFSLSGVLKKKNPESLVITNDFIDYDTGTPLPLVASALNQNTRGSSLSLWRRVYSKIPRGENGINCDHNPSRLYFDKDLKRIIVGKTLPEPEIELLYSLIKQA